MEQTPPVDAGDDKTKMGVWGKIYNFMLCGGWILTLVAILGIAIWLDNLFK